MILKLLAGIWMVARPVTFEMVDNEAAATFGVTLFGMVTALPTTADPIKSEQKIFVRGRSHGVVCYEGTSTANRY